MSAAECCSNSFKALSSKLRDSRGAGLLMAQGQSLVNPCHTWTLRRL